MPRNSLKNSRNSVLNADLHETTARLNKINVLEAIIDLRALTNKFA